MLKVETENSQDASGVSFSKSEYFFLRSWLNFCRLVAIGLTISRFLSQRNPIAVIVIVLHILLSVAMPIAGIVIVLHYIILLSFAMPIAGIVNYNYNL